MGSLDTALATEAPIIHQAATMAADAVRAATICRCRQCRAHAVQTFDWSVGRFGVDDFTARE